MEVRVPVIPGTRKGKVSAGGREAVTRAGALGAQGRGLRCAQSQRPRPGRRPGSRFPPLARSFPLERSVFWNFVIHCLAFKNISIPIKCSSPFSP